MNCAGLWRASIIDEGFQPKSAGEAHSATIPTGLQASEKNFQPGN
jgi:hypothetical protein